MSWDVAKSVELHNRIVAHARSHLPPEHQPTIQRNWFAVHSIDPASPGFEFNLDDELTEFLSGIDLVVPNDASNHLAFNPVLVGIVNPHGRYGLRTQSWEDWDDDHADLIVLYQNTGYDPAGLVYNLETQQVTYLEDAFTSPYEPDEMKLPWADLDEVLQLYWDCVESGKFVIDTQNPGFGEPDNLATQGWRVELCTEKEMDQVLSVWGSLVDAIAKRLPASDMRGEKKEDEDQTEDESPQRKKRRKHEKPLISTEVLDKYPAIPPFVRTFLSKAKKPPFKSIAPQIDVPDENFIHRIGAEMQKIYPDATLEEPQHEISGSRMFLLFPWRTSGIELLSERDQENWNSKRGSNILDNRGGIYIQPDDFYSYCGTLLLPFPLGSNGHVLRGDDTKVKAYEPGQDVLYQRGVGNPFVPGWGTPLTAILINWWEQVENDSWDVDENGVAGGDELWKKADTEEDAEDFKI
ncbi:hypothetical protein J4E93_001164 [Alternaria ventricosa]|uniref:uncharacterized protein n=1 Tax=Alternaria ventricosa TaxID=1187951 RepID=UPI0020C3F8F8|nr:uncharacterized protein J4E93_001164 [Alternaria ventricosa]KAI4653398.1 hypothetical protein J4E93_001164 [Alternaria ventricosa]